MGRDVAGRFTKKGFNEYTIEGDIVKLFFSTGDIALIDRKNLESIQIHRWNIVNKCGKKYVFTRVKLNGKQNTIYLHRLLLGVTDSRVYVDHIDGNSLNNCVSNLRLSTNAENQQNTSYSRNSRTRVRGVSLCKTTGKYKCQLVIAGKMVYHARFDTLDEAGRHIAYQRQLHCTHLPKNHRYIFNLMSVLPHSGVNGEGDRYVVWAQGCGFGCKGCFNPDSWSFKTNKLIYVDELVRDILASGCDGVTISGGEPLLQSGALLKLLRALEPKVLSGELKYGIICYTGFREEEYSGRADVVEILRLVDVLIDGRYEEELKTSDSIAGSSNQGFRFNLSQGRGESVISRSSLEEIDKGVEIHPSVREKTVQITGFPNINRRLLKSFGLTVEHGVK